METRTERVSCYDCGEFGAVSDMVIGDGNARNAWEVAPKVYRHKDDTICIKSKVAARRRDSRNYVVCRLCGASVFKDDAGSVNWIEWIYGEGYGHTEYSCNDTKACNERQAKQRNAEREARIRALKRMIEDGDLAKQELAAMELAAG